MVKDRIGNVVEVGDKVMAQLPDPSMIGFISDIQEPSVISSTPGRVFISCVIALPILPEYGAVGQIVKVHDVDKEATHATLEAMKLKPKAN